MSDKSFGDHASRNIVKNPLLSTAVTGLSIEDLTHNAVLLPAAPTQGLFSRSEHQIGSQHRPLGNPGHGPANQPSGDSNPIFLPSHHSTTALPTIPDQFAPTHHEASSEISTRTQSNALPKSDDHFDVNEYFARLQGTRYVSAPLNSQISDKNANLAATEENLEEINLNDDKTEIQQSLTSDIAQNFSQLPTVLPHMASAVFNSFSSMLSMKSREVTPDEGKGNRGVVEETVPLMCVDNEVKEVAPPPREPPVTGPGNYRLTTKKKYAQIPGLSSFDNQPSPYNPISSTNPTFTTRVEDSTVNFSEKPGDHRSEETNPFDSFNAFNIEKVEQPNPKEEAKQTEYFNVPVFNPSNFEPNIQTVSKEPEFSFPEQQQAVIPPPPMFSTQRNDQSAGKSVLPPSVARRIGTNHPVMKQHTVQAVAVENIFVPTFDPAPAETLPSQAPIFAPTIESTLTSPAMPAQTAIGLQQPISTQANLPPPTMPPPMFSATIPSSTATPSVPPSASSLTNVFAPPPQVPLANIFTPTSPPMPSQSMATSLPQAPSLFAAQPPSSVTQPLFNPTIESTQTDPTKPLVMPPKAAEGVNYRMAKKRPQYYSGPIEGVGAISNNSKPVLPPVETATFQGALFIPDQATSNLNTVPTKPFDISHQSPFDVQTNVANMPIDSQIQTGLVDTVNTISIGFNVPKPIEDLHKTAYAPTGDVGDHMYAPTNKTQAYYDTAFDLSRSTTEAYEEPKETKTFGIIGSLKSKLSAIDINKIQSTVTTFFDPGFNDVKKDDTGTHETVPYSRTQQEGDFEICVPNVSDNQRYTQNEQQENVYYDQYTYQKQGYSSYYSNPEALSSYPSYGTQSQYPVDSNAYGTQVVTSNTESIKGNIETHFITATEANAGETFDNTKHDVKENTVVTSDDITKAFAPQMISTESFNVPQNITPDANSAKSFFDTNIGQSSDIIHTILEADRTTFITSKGVKPQAIEASSYAVESFAPSSFEQRQELPVPKQQPIINPTAEDYDKKPIDVFYGKKELPRADNLLESITKDNEIPVVGVSSVPLFGLSTMIDTSSKETIDASVPLFDTDASTILFNKNETLFSSVEPAADENVSELNICETCREFNKPDGEHDIDLTAQLIENINAPIQLSNAVEVPFTEPKVAVDDNTNENNQFEEISHITEETIETIQIQSATELLDDENLPPKNYGWATEQEYPPSDTPPEHDYMFKIDPNTIGFYGNNSLFFDNVPTGASCETKAAFEHYDDYPSPGAPTAPPAEDDTKSDETGGLDVHSIEQDAKKDFPIYEEFVIEPSEEDTIEFSGREGADTRESDTFTNRVERFKHMEEVNDEQNSMFELSSPPLSMASYFDTGNFAVETHYRNSIGSPNLIRIPPGFEEEFQNRLIVSLDLRIVSDTSTQTTPVVSDVTHTTPIVVPNTSTQTKTTQALTMSTPAEFTTSTTQSTPFAVPNTSTQTKITEALTISTPDVFSTSTTQAIPFAMPTQASTASVATTQSFGVPITQPLPLSVIPNTSTQTKTTQDVSYSRLQNFDIGLTTTNSRIVDDAIRITDAFSSEQGISLSEPPTLTGDVIAIFTDKSNDSRPNNDGDLISSAGSLFDVTKNNQHSSVFGFRVTDDTLSNIGLIGAQFEPKEDIIYKESQPKPIGFGARDATLDLKVTPGLATSGAIESIRPIFGAGPNISERLIRPTLLEGFTKGFESKDVSPMTDIPISLLPSTLIEEAGLNTKTESKQAASITQEQYPPTSFSLKDNAKTTLFGETEIVEDKVEGAKIKKDLQKNEPITLASNFFEVFASTDDGTHEGFVPKEVVTPFKTIASDVTTKTEKLPDFATAFGATAKTEASLPDPINFFSSDTPEQPAEGFNRLASYFSSPPKTEHAKSFFELSQSQNHYRHPNEPNYTDLIKHLTSPQHIQIKKDDTVRHVNYFTVEHNIESKLKTAKNNKDMYVNKIKLDKGQVANEINTGSNIHNIKHNTKACNDTIRVLETADREVNDTKNSEIDYFNDTIQIVRDCENCGINCNHYKFRSYMDDRNGETDRNISDMDKDKDNRRSVTVNFEGISLDEEANEGVAVLTEGRSSAEYAPVKHHWFYRVDIEDKSIWRGFSLSDSRALEMAYLGPNLDETTLVATDGGRYDVNIVGRLRIPVYWDDKPTNVRRCSWFYKGTTDARYVPYTEQVAEKLEEEYRHGVTRGEWHRRLSLPNGEVVVMHGPGVMVHFLHSGAADTFSGAPLFSFGKRVYRNPPKIRVSQDQPSKIDHLILFVHGAGECRSHKARKESTSRPRVVRRGHDESEIEDSEPSSIDHLLLLCHGVGSACDMRFRPVEEVVEDFRATSLQLLQSHYRNSYDKGVVSRIEVLPISWHASLHSGEEGVDRRLAQITLDSIPRLRHFTNDTLLDVLFYTSPVFSQTIIDTVCKELNRIYSLFRQRNPDFRGGVSLGGHSLGSVILYDLLCHQTHETKNEGNPPSAKTYVTGSPGFTMEYPKLAFSPDSLYALGSPIAIFECIRGVESLGLNFSLPTCRNFFNVFHPYDPIAYRIEPLINPLLKDLKPLLIPHHKGRKRMHLELKDTMARVGADLKQKVLESLRTTWNKWKAQPSPNGQLPNVIEDEMEKEPLSDESKEELANSLSTPEMLGLLNGGRRIDYVLQEAPLEMINEYIFAMSSHVGYWESEDTMLLMLREIYGALGVQPDCTVPQQSMTVQRARTPRQDDNIVLNNSGE